ncbi:MAG: T9SS type A sorting domain-containing protein [Ignavibacteriaceae bacterium]|nr:T9SS type A sorting domain-containing protein [Ignavibacteriaceae bacterium]
MNRINQIIIILLLSVIYPLYPRGLDTLNYFPHAVGNVWQYIYDDGRFFQEKIYQDSIDSIGNTFLNFGPTLPMFYWSYRINATNDSIFYLPYAMNHLQYKFLLDSGEIFERDTSGIFFGKVYDTYDVIIFGIVTHAIEIRYYGGHPDSFYAGWEYTEILANNIGKIWYGNEVEYMTLIGCVIDGDTSGVIFTDVKEENPELLPASIELYQNYPNPFNSATTIAYELSVREKVELAVYDILGKKIKILAEGEFPKGNYKISFDAEALSSGIYYYSLVTTNRRTTKKMILLK